MYVRRDTLEHENRDDWANVRRVAEYLKAYRGRALLALLCLIFAKWANIGVPLILRDLVDSFDKSQQILILPISLLLAYGALKLANSLFSELRDTVFARVRYHAMRQLSNQVLEHLHTLSLRFHLERKTGAISRDLERGTRSVSTMMNFMVFSFIPIFVEFSLVAIILLYNYDGIFALITFGTIVVYGLFTVAISNWRINYRHTMNRLDSEANTQAFDSLINYETVKYFNNENLELDRYDKTLSEWEGMAVKSQTSMSVLNFGQSAIIAVGVTIIMFFAANQVVEDRMSIGDLVMVNAFMLQLFIPLGALGMIYRQFKYTMADMDLVFKLLSKTPEIRDAAEAKEIAVGKGEVRFNNVHFGYQEDRKILTGISFTVPAGKTVAVVGHSGAGKSTLARLLFRFYDVNEGQVLIDGNDVRDVTQNSLRKLIGIVPQDTVLFNDTIHYNIQYGNLNASDAEVREAAAMAHIDEFIDSLPEGWETRVGERGLKLSGGEKQRVAIARAILKRPAILVFDEATSSLDSTTEQAIQRTLKHISATTTTLVVAHRLSTVVDADEILVMGQGNILERGSHAELILKDGEYRRMWELQLETNDVSLTETKD